MSGPRETDIAIIGMAGRFPGAPTLAQFWRNLRDGRESIVTLSNEALRAAGVPESTLANPDYVPRAAVLEDMESFDAGFFGFSPREAAVLDPQHRHFLECAWHALEDAGHSPARFPGAIGVFGGSGLHAYLMFNLLSHPELIEEMGLFLVRHTGNDKDFLATRVSYALNLRGPSLNVQTACSTSLVATHLACQHLLSGECDLALAGGSTIELPHRVGYLVREGEILSPDGHCRPFDAAAQGTVFSSGVGVVVLRRLADALADGDCIRAVIKGSAVNNDGSLKVGYLAPSVDGQAAAIAEALAVAETPADSISYVEAHGTGTAVGDPIEVAALTQAFRAATSRTGFCAIGSVKSNIGHADTAAGVASLIKTTLALQHRELPATLHFQAPNPAIDFAGSPFFVNDRLRPWPSERGPRRAGISSLGVGGTNAHLILEEAPALPAPHPDDRPYHLFPLSAKSSSALTRQGAQLAEHLQEHPELLASDVAFTLQESRTALPYRRVEVCGGIAEAAATLSRPGGRNLIAGHARPERRSLAFMFAGGGAQHPGMGRDLYQYEPAYREAIEACATILEAEAGISLLDLLSTGLRPDLDLDRPSLGLPALFATQYAGAMLLRTWGLEPDALIGHSMGEYTAACLAGVFSLRDALRLVVLRGRLFEEVPPGGMLSVQLGARELAPLLGAELSIAASNAPGLAVASGPREALERLAEELTGRGIEHQPVHIRVAAHSAMLEPILGRFRQFLQEVRLSAPRLPVVSNLSGTWLTATQATDPEYWTRHLRETVRFADGVGVLLEGDSRRVLLEVGPGTTLTTLSQLHPALGASHLVAASLPRPGEDTSALKAILGAVGRLWVAGVDLDWANMRRGAARRRVPLPVYPFERERHWIDPRPRAEVRDETETGGVARAADPRAWFYLRTWHSAPPIPPAGTAFDWLLILAGADSLADQLVRQATPFAKRIVLARPGTEFRRLAANEYQVRPGSREDHERLLQALGPPRSRGAIVHAWLLAAAAGNEGQCLGYDALVAAVAAAAGVLGGAPLRLAVLTTAAFPPASEPGTDPRASLLPAATRVIARELPEFACMAVEVTPPPGGSWAEAALAAQILETLNSTASGVLRCSAGTLWKEAFEQYHPGSPVNMPGLVRRGGVYLITGGLGGLGRIAAAELAAQGAGTLVLVSRNGVEPRTEWRRLAGLPGARAGIYRDLLALDASGVTVVPHRADLADRDQATALIGFVLREYEGLDGVIHAAGLLDDAPLLAKEPADLHRILAPKVEGAINLDAAIGSHPLDFFLLYSSISAVAGIPGQVDYAAANAFLDAFAAARTARTGSYTVSIGWPAWRSVGMVGQADETPGVDPQAHPLLTERRDLPGGEVEFVAKLAPHDLWILDEHRLRSGTALMPGAGFIELARAAAADVMGAGQVVLTDTFFTAPFVVADDEAREIRIRVSPDGAFIIRSPGPGGNTAWVEHASGSVAVTPVTPPAEPADITSIRGRCTSAPEASQVARAKGHLRFGPRWNARRATRFGEGEALLELELAEEFAGDLEVYGVHPALLDIATAGAQELIRADGPTTDFFVPVGYGRVEIIRPIPARCLSHIRFRTPAEADAGVAVFDADVTDEAGRLLVRVEEFTMQRLRDPSRLAAVAPAGAPVPAGAATPLALGIDPAEGVAVLRHVLLGGMPPHVLVSPYPIEHALSLLAPEGQRVVDGAGGANLEHEPGTDRTDPALASVAEAIRQHPAVRDAAVAARSEGGTGRRLLAWFVPDPAEPLTISELRAHVRGLVPEELVPPNFVEVDAIPRDAGGGPLHANLPDPFARADDHTPPSTLTEEWLAGIWREVLGADRVGRHDNFFDIGGHSLLSIRVITRVRKERGIRLTQADMVLQTLEQLADACDRRQAEAAIPAENLAR